MQYNGLLEDYSDFHQKIKEFPKQGVLLGHVVCTPYQYKYYGMEPKYFKKLIKSKEAYEDEGKFLTECGLTPEHIYSDPKKKDLLQTKQIAANACSDEIFGILKGSSNKKKGPFLSDDQKVELVELINKSAFTKIGLLLDNHLDYKELSPGSLKGIDGEIYKKFATDARFKIKFEHVLRYYRYYIADECGNPELDEGVYRFSQADLKAMLNGKKPTKKVDPDLHNTAFFQLGKGKVLFEFKHEGGSLTGGWFFPEEMQSINFCPAMVISKVKEAMDCETDIN